MPSQPSPRERPRPSAALAASAAREHAALRAAIRALRAEVAGHDPVLLASSVRALRARLARHFALEEAAWIAAGAEDDAPPAARLTAQHRDLEARVAYVQVEVERCARRCDEPRPALRRALLELLADLLRHERAESGARVRGARRRTPARG